MSDIAPGYLLKVTTWENDGDNYNTVDHSGLTQEQVRFYIHVCEKFKCGNWAENQGSFGNEEVRPAAFHQGMKAHIAAFTGEVNPDWLPEDEDEEGLDDDDCYFYQDLVSDLGINSTEYGYWRVFESVEVFLVPEAIKDVTAQFQAE